MLDVVTLLRDGHIIAVEVLAFVMLVLLGFRLVTAELHRSKPKPRKQHRTIRKSHRKTSR
jgi:hypothetical protein